MTPGYRGDRDVPAIVQNDKWFTAPGDQFREDETLAAEQEQDDKRTHQRPSERVSDTKRLTLARDKNTIESPAPLAPLCSTCALRSGASNRVC